jgi:hypothetical protein
VKRLIAATASAAVLVGGLVGIAPGAQALAAGSFTVSGWSSGNLTVNNLTIARDAAGTYSVTALSFTVGSGTVTVNPFGNQGCTPAGGECRVISSSDINAKDNFLGYWFVATLSGMDGAAPTLTMYDAKTSGNFWDGFGTTPSRVMNATLAAPPAISPTTQTVDGAVGTPITPTTPLTQSGFSVPAMYTVSSLPSGLAWEAVPGVLDGTPTAGGTWNIVVSADNGSDSATATITVSIMAAPEVDSVSTVPAGGLLTVNYSIPQPQGMVLGIEYRLGSGPWQQPGGTAPSGSVGGSFTLSGVTAKGTTITLRSVSTATPPLYAVGIPADVTFASPPTMPAAGSGGPAARVPTSAGGPVPGGTSNGAGSGTNGAAAAATGDAGIDAPCLAANGTLYPNQFSTVGSQLTMAPNTHGMPKVATFEVVKGSLAPGTMLDKAVGVISGVTTQPGTYTTTIKATFVNGRKVTSTFATRVDADPQALQYAARNIGTLGVTITIAPTTNAPTIGTSYRIVCGRLPAGMRFDPSTGVVSGLPTKTVLLPTPLRIAEGSPTGQAAASFIFVVNKAGASSISYPAHPHLRASTRVRIRPTVSGPRDFRAFRMWKGKLPKGLKLNRVTGIISGRPAHAGRTHTITIVAVTKTGALVPAPLQINVR